MLTQVNALTKLLATSFCNVQTMPCMTLKTLSDTKAEDIEEL